MESLTHVCGVSIHVYVLTRLFSLANLLHICLIIRPTRRTLEGEGSLFLPQNINERKERLQRWPQSIRKHQPDSVEGEGHSAGLMTGWGLNIQISKQLTKGKSLLHFNHFSYTAIWCSLGEGEVRTLFRQTLINCSILIIFNHFHNDLPGRETFRLFEYLFCTLENHLKW